MRPRASLLWVALAILGRRTLRGAWRGMDAAATAVAWGLGLSLVFLLTMTMGMALGAVVTAELGTIRPIELVCRVPGSGR